MSCDVVVNKEQWTSAVRMAKVFPLAVEDCYTAIGRYGLEFAQRAAVFAGQHGVTFNYACCVLSTTTLEMNR